MKTFRFSVGVALGAALVFAARSASAQDPLTNAKKAAQKAAAATNAHIEAEQRPEGARPAPSPAAKRSMVVASTRTAAGKVQQDARSQEPLAEIDTAGPPPSILREAYAYSRDGRRDPFFSLLMTNELRPTLSDLKLVGILVDHSGGRSVATLHDLGTNAQYRVTTGATLGRMRVSSIKLTSVVFTIDEFGTTRQDSLILRDTTKVRR